ncbi:MAG TPA: hypothetical protein VGN07_19820 [Steroidobacteraceae bacterium]|jgi:hypothetical protein
MTEETTDIRRAMAQSIREEQQRAERQVKAIARSASIDLDRFAKPVGETSQPTAQNKASKNKSTR